MKPGVQQIVDGLYQSALADVPSWHSMSMYVSMAVCMAEPLTLPGVQTISFPINDNADGCECLDAVRALAKQVAPYRVLSICHMGENRSGLLSALVLVERGWTPQAAVELTQRNGPHNSPTQAHSFWNPGFVRQVLAL